MTSILRLRTSSVSRAIKSLVYTFALVCFMGAGGTMVAQCVDHPQGKTTVRLNNETSFDLTFFVDDDENGIAVPSRTVSTEVEVEPGEHLLRASVVIPGQTFWLWSVNQIPKGQICTWTATDPQRPKNKENYNDKQQL